MIQLSNSKQLLCCLKDKRPISKLEMLKDGVVADNLTIGISLVEINSLVAKLSKIRLCVHDVEVENGLVSGSCGVRQVPQANVFKWRLHNQQGQTVAQSDSWSYVRTYTLHQGEDQVPIVLPTLPQL